MSHPLKKLLGNRIAIIDGAMGTTIRTYGMGEADIRADRFKDSKKDLLNNGDIISLTQPAMICDIHRPFEAARTSSRQHLRCSISGTVLERPARAGGHRTPPSIRRSSRIRSSTGWPGRSTSSARREWRSGRQRRRRQPWRARSGR
jgi:5-methyltetrahydrofolate--homocysteine methyltransferase